jgi:hypothetical protein
MSDPVLDILSAFSGTTPVAAGGTITFQYPTGRARAVYMDAGPSVMGVRSSQAIYNQDTDFTIVLGTDSVVVTFLGVIPIAAASTVTLQLPIRDTSGQPTVAGYPLVDSQNPSGL